MSKRVISVDPINISTFLLDDQKDIYNYYVTSIDNNTIEVKNKWTTITIDITDHPELKVLKLGAKIDVKFG